LDGLPQDPEWHPEGDVLVHTAHCLDALVTLPIWKSGDAQTRRVLSFAVLAHDFAPETKQWLLSDSMRIALQPDHFCQT
jgi:tRNA nucleotidyltransferase (CCA-adding enzyme)